MIIGISGPPGVGKTTLAREIRAQRATTQLLSFASPIKDAIEAMFHQNILDKTDTPPGFDNLTYRTLLQSLGTEWARNLDPDFWIKIAAPKITENPQWLTVFDDVRFPNEASFIRQRGGLLVRLHRNDVWNDEQVMLHASELQELDHDLYLENLTPEQGASEVLREATR